MKETVNAIAFKEWRIKESITQVKLAKKLNLTQTDLSRAEKGEKKPYYKVRKRMKDLMSIDIDLFNEQPNKIKNQQSHNLELHEVCIYAVEHKQEVFLNKTISVSVNFKII